MKREDRAVDASPLGFGGEYRYGPDYVLVEEERRADEALLASCREVVRSSGGGAFEVEVREGVVTLRGVSRDENAARSLGAALRRLDGARAVCVAWRRPEE